MFFPITTSTKYTNPKVSTKKKRKLGLLLDHVNKKSEYFLFKMQVK